jgi:hypothetical protein
VINFNDDVTPFESLADLIGADKSKALLSRTNAKGNYRLVLFSQIEGQRFTHTIEFDN